MPDRVNLSSSLRDQLEELRSDLGHRSTVNPVVGPELALGATANAPGSRGAKDGADIGIVRDVQVAPGARGILR